MVLFCSELIGFKHLRCFEVPFRALHSAHDQCAKCLRVRLDAQLLYFGKPLSLANENEGFAVPSRTVADLYSPVLAFKVLSSWSLFIRKMASARHHHQGHPEILSSLTRPFRAATSSSKLKDTTAGWPGVATTPGRC